MTSQPATAEFAVAARDDGPPGGPDRRTRMLICQVARLLRGVDASGPHGDPGDDQRQLEAMAVALDRVHAPAASPVAALRALLHENRRLHHKLAVCRHHGTRR